MQCLGYFQDQFADGSVTKVQEFQVGGCSLDLLPLNNNGELLAVARQTSNRAVIIKRDVLTGMTTLVEGFVGIASGVPAVVWDEKVDGD